MSETIYFLYIFEEMINQKYGLCYFCFLDQNSVIDYNLQVSARDLLPLRKNERSTFLNKLLNRLVNVSVSLPIASNSLQLQGLEPARLLSMEFSRQEYWSGLPFLSPGDLSDPGIEPRSPALQAVSSFFFPFFFLLSFFFLQAVSLLSEP